MTHHYTILIRGTVISGRDEPDVTAIAWAADTVIAIGSDDEVRETSRGDSHVIDLQDRVHRAIAYRVNDLEPTHPGAEPLILMARR